MMNKAFKALLEPVQLQSGLQLHNRLVMAPMTNYASHEDGTVSPQELQYYARRSAGVGAVITACTYVSGNGKGFPGEFGGHSDEMTSSLAQLADTIHSGGAKAILQIFHGGRSCPPELVNGDVVSASAVASEERGGGVQPRSLSDEEIRDIISDFGETTRRAIEAGYDGVEIHGANGYLIHQFFSTHSNRREDEWGGSLEKRMAFPLAVVKEVTDVVRKKADRPFAVGYRFSPEEATTPGFTLDDTLALVDKLAEEPLDYLHVSLMDYTIKPRTGPDVTKTTLALLLDTIGTRKPLIGVGSVHTPEQAMEVLAAGSALVALGRELIVEPDWVKKVEEGREESIRTTVGPEDQEELVVPDALWNAIMNVPGWFPVRDRNEAH
ncbi:NADH-dependent flavin oxidoreductase [Paenibacillus sp. F411]|uniref:NADH-dependent flavin oxidoreductase n=1 Tax=Paenibacillus sp. F411 TaxID=2820239 RepID=UPI001AAF09C6|nr:NADH-dependent flavin oxidoreductase [Paenibacillus sp. F411]MBO2945319.1 NADH-dependent flavin oxidoreductase [Paenibacillus sp. F411]